MKFVLLAMITFSAQSILAGMTPEDVKRKIDRLDKEIQSTVKKRNSAKQKITDASKNLSGSRGSVHSRSNVRKSSGIQRKIETHQKSYNRHNDKLKALQKERAALGERYNEAVAEKKKKDLKSLENKRRRKELEAARMTKKKKREFQEKIKEKMAEMQEKAADDEELKREMAEAERLTAGEAPVEAASDDTSPEDEAYQKQKEAFLDQYK